MKTFEGGKNSKELGIDKTRKFIVVNNHGYTRINKGDILELYEDDGSSCPIFNNLTTGKLVYCFLYDLYYADYKPLRDIINSEEYNKLLFNNNKKKKSSISVSNFINFGF